MNDELMKASDCMRFLNEYIAIYPERYKYKTEMEMSRVMESWRKLLGNDVKVDYLIEALYDYEKRNETGKHPSIVALKTEAKRRANRKGRSSAKRRIMTPEEDCWNEYKELMALGKDMSKEDIDRAKALQRYALLFEGEGWEERYIAHFGRPREEFERL